MNQIPQTRDMIPLPDFFSFKVIVKGEGLNENEFLALAQQELARPLGSPELSIRPSRKGNYRAYSLKLFIEAYEEIETLYLAFRNLPDVLMVL